MSNDEKRVYDAESYAVSFMSDKSIYQDDRRIFHRGDCDYAIVMSVKSARLEQDIFLADLELSDGSSAMMSIVALFDGCIRLKFWKDKADFMETSDMLFLKDFKVLKAQLETCDDAYRLNVSNRCIYVNKSLFSIKVTDSKGRLLMKTAENMIAGEYPTPPLGFRKIGAVEQPFFSWQIANDEQFFGLGEKWNKVEKSSTRCTVWSTETCGSNSTDMSYKALPLLFSTKGWGVLNHSYYRSNWEVGTFSYPAGSMITEDSKLDLFLFLAPSLKELLGVYTELSGRPSMPPRWAMGVWMSRCQYEKRAEADEVVAKLREYRIPTDVIHLDPLWMKTHYYFKIGVDACDFVTNDSGFPNQQQMFADFLEQGFHTSLWINPYLPEGQPIYDEAASKDYLLKSLNGGLARLVHGQAVGMVDFTNPNAYEWWKEHLRVLLRRGAAVLKPDYGDCVPEDALGFDGRTGLELHNYYVYLFSKAAYEAAEEVRGEGFVWRRPGYVGSQRFPGTWAGDTEVSWVGLKHCMRGGLSAGLSGEAFWTSDIGGFVGPKPSPELYIRWAQFGMLSPLTRFHGTCPKEPWHYGDKAVEVVRDYAELRYSLMPYLFNIAREATISGLPLMRHMKLEFQSEPNVETLDDQYMLGPDLLVAPIVNEGALERFVYLPEGRWFEFDHPENVHEGRRFVHQSAPLERIPLLVREGAVIPRYVHNPQHLKEPAAEELRIDIYAGTSNKFLCFSEYEKEFDIRYSSDHQQSKLEIQPVDMKVTLRLIGFERFNSQAWEGKTVDVLRRDGETLLSFDAKAGASLTW
ncbi:MAG: glycoside hydrolase family 31 protein [Bacillota bacterium]